MVELLSYAHQMDMDRVRQIKQLAIIALISDDQLLELLVLKGGSAIELLHPTAGRQSLDIDFSIDGDLEGDAEDLCIRFEHLLNNAFEPEGFRVFDVRFEPQPQEPTPMLAFWGGYVLEFKIAEIEIYEKLKNKIEKLRKHAADVGPGTLKTMRVELSKHEHCSGKQEYELEGYSVYVYTPLMIACEKLRAICQQFPEYRELVKSRKPASRARDFFDIHYLSKEYDLDWESAETREMVRAMFAAKHVPLKLLARISECHDLHEQSFRAVQETVLPGFELNDFEFYFNQILDIASQLQALWKE